MKQESPEASYRRRLYRLIPDYQVAQNGGVLGLGYGGQAQGSDNSLSFTPWKELP
jgi:hypothetical protein